MHLEKIDNGSGIVTFVLRDYGREVGTAKIPSHQLNAGPVDIKIGNTAFYFRHHPSGEIIETDGPRTAYRLV